MRKKGIYRKMSLLRSKKSILSSSEVKANGEGRRGGDSKHLESVPSFGEQIFVTSRDGFPSLLIQLSRFPSRLTLTGLGWNAIVWLPRPSRPHTRRARLVASRSLRRAERNRACRLGLLRGEVRLTSRGAPRGLK